MNAKMNKTPSPLWKFGPLVFYFLEIPFWLIFSFPILAGGDIRKTLGLLGFLAIPLYGLFIIASLGAHISFLVTHQYRHVKLLLLVNVLSTLGFPILTLMVMMWALYH